MTGACIGLRAARLVNKSVVRLRGPDSFPYLQLFLTNDIRHLFGGDDGRKHCLYSHLINSNGRTLVDVFVYKPFEESVDRSISRKLVLAPFHVDDFGSGGYETDEVLLETPSKLSPALIRMLLALKLRKRLTVEPYEMDVWTLYPGSDQTPLPYFPATSSPDIIISPDPRLPFLGYRMLSRLSLKSLAQVRQLLSLSESDVVEESATQYQSFLHSNGVGEGEEDHPHAQGYPLESNADILNGMCFTKGMHAGDWVTGRNVRRGVEYRLLPIRISDKSSSKLLASGSALWFPNGELAGKVRSMSGVFGLASLHWKNIARAQTKSSETIIRLVHEESKLTVECHIPDWWYMGVKALPDDHKNRFLLPLNNLKPAFNARAD